MITAAMFALVDEAGLGVLVLCEHLQEDEFRRSRLTRPEVRRQLQLMADTLGSLPEAARRAMPEIAWDGWRHLGAALAEEGAAADDAAWFAVRSLVPATLSWLRVFRRSQPAWFDYATPSSTALH